MSNRTLTLWTARACSLLALTSAIGCQSPAPDEPIQKASSAIWNNGSFETGAAGTAPGGWTVTPYLNPGVTISTPQARSGLNLASGGSALTTILNSPGGAESQPDAALGAGASLRWPKYGNQVALVNQGGKNKNTNSMSQTMTVASGDVDPADAQIHVRFVVAPVLENPNHSADQQPYYFVQLTNITRNSTMYIDYNASAQPGVPWKISNGYYYTDWQLVDIAPGTAQLAIGDQIKLEVIAAGCSLGGHFGQVYVDGIGSTIPGIFVAATGPTAANAGSNITYKLNYQNGGTTPVAGTTVAFNTPDGTVFQSINAPGLTCSTPVVGTSGLVTCVVGSLPAGASGSFTVTTLINPLTTGTITEGNYSIYGTAVSPLLGPKVYTNVTNGITYADMGLTMTDNANTVIWGQNLTYTIVATNAGPNAVTGASVLDTFPATLHNVTWTCAGAGGATCAAAGSGDINDGTVAIPVGGTVTYTVNASVVSGQGGGQVANVASVQLPALAVDFAPINNSAGVYNTIVSPNGTGCSLNSDCASGVCDPAGGICIPTGGCGADVDCAGTPNTWCNTQSFTCVPKLANSVAIPTVGGHNPPLTGACTGPAGAAVCLATVCETSDDKCGLDTGDGPCSAVTAFVCRSGACSNSGKCEPSGGCLVDSDCTPGNWCDETTSTCTAKISNGGQLPVDGPHTAPTLDGQCRADAAQLVCQSGVCDVDNKCGFANGDGACTGNNASTVCRSGACDASDLHCGYINGDGPCSGNGALCRSNVCDIDGLCGYGNGDGPCTTADAAIDCRSGICATQAPLAGTCEQCASALDCSGLTPACDTATATCHQCTITDPSACLGVTPVCNGANDTCAACNGDHASGGTLSCGAAAPYCVASGLLAGSCGKCLTNLDCVGTHNGPICDLASGACGTTCAVDGDCKADGSEWCDAHVCTPKTANGLPLPSDSPIDGLCSAANGTRVCVSGVCDTDNKCGLKNGDGACDATNGSSICRSTVCTTAQGANLNTCEECNVDNDCHDPLKPACDATTNACVQCSSNNQNACLGTTPTCNTATEHCAPCGGDNGTTALNACPTASAPYCETNGGCGLCVTNNDCVGAHAGPICDAASGACGTACSVDADCNDNTKWCDASANATGVCVPKLANGTKLPASPFDVSVCNEAAGARVCSSGVCDTADNKCGLGDNELCTEASECRIGACTNGKCALPDSVPLPHLHFPTNNSDDATSSAVGGGDSSTSTSGVGGSAANSGFSLSGGAGLSCSTSMGAAGGPSASALTVLVALGLLGSRRRRSPASRDLQS